MAEPIYVRAPDGSIGTIDASDAQRAADAGYQVVSPEEISGAQASRAASVGAGQAVTEGLLTAPDDYSVGRAFGEKALSAATFGLAPGLDSPGARARGLRFAEEHPGKAFAAEVAGQLPAAVALEVGTAGLGGVVAGAGAAARAGFRAAEFGTQALVGGAQTEAEETRLSGEEFSWTDAAVTGLAGEAIGRGAVWGFSSALGASRNLLARAQREAVAQDASSSLTRGGLLNDFRVAHHAEQYQNELSALAADDLDRLETGFAEVSRQDRKRARIVRQVAGDTGVQAGLRAEAQAGLAGLYDALAAELGDAPGPARSLLRQLDERAEKLASAQTPQKLWRLLDENRQALQEYAQDLHQAYDAAPGSAWLSREGLARLDAAEAATREALLREDAWGRQAVEAQRAYNVPFNEKYFPTSKTVRSKLMQTTGYDAKGFPVYRGDPGKVRSFFTRGPGDVDSARLSEQFRDYLDGVEAIARAGQADTPRAARETLEAVRRLRKAAANAEYVQAAAARSADRGRLVEVGAEAAGAALAGAAAGPLGGAVAFGALRGARAGDFLLRAARKLGWGAGEAESMAALLGRDALPAVDAPDGPLVADDLADAARRPSSDPPPSGGGGGAPPASGPQPGPGRGPTPSMLADAQRGSWAPSEAPPAAGTVAPDDGASFVDELAPEPAPGVDDALAAAGRPGRAERASAETTPVPGGREVRSRQVEALELEGLREQTAARRRDEARVAALTEGEFSDLVRQLEGSADERAQAFADKLRANLAALKTAGLVVATGGGAAALAAEDQPEGAAGAAAVGLGLLAGKLPGFTRVHHVAQQLGFDAKWLSKGKNAFLDDDATDSLLKRKISGPEGSNDGGWYEGGVRTGKQYVKFYENPDQAVGEYVANRIYGPGKAVHSKLAVSADGRVAHVAEEAAPGMGWAHLPVDQVTPAQARQFVKGFWEDVWLANWDVVGLTGDNLLWADDIVKRVDNGSSLRFRAQGAEKPEAALRELTEVDGFFNPQLNPNYAALLKKAGVASPKDLLPELDALLRKWDDGVLGDFLDGLPPDVESLLMYRYHKLQDLRHALESPAARHLRENLGASRRLGAMFHARPDEAAAVVERARAELGPPEEDLASSTWFSSVMEQPGLKELVSVSKQAVNRLTREQRTALSDWVGTSRGIRAMTSNAADPVAERAGVMQDAGSAGLARAKNFMDAMEALTVVDPTKHGMLFRFIDLDDRALAEALSRDEFVVTAPTSTGYVPDPNFGATEFRFEQVDAAGALIGLNPAESEMILLPDSRFRKTAQYYDAAKDKFIFVFSAVPETTKSPVFGDIGHLSLGPLTLGAGVAAAEASAAGEPVAQEDGAAEAAGAPTTGQGAAFAAAVGLFRANRQRTVRDVARRMFSAAAEPAVRTTARLAYSRAQLAERQEEFSSWQADPQALVDRVAEGLRDAPPSAFASAAQGVFAAASFLREKLPQAHKPNPVALRATPVNAEATAKFARYEQAALRPGEALREAAESQYLSPELLETLQELYPDLLAEVRVAAYQAVREGAALSVQAKTQYARLFDGDGAVADPAFGATAVQMVNYAYEQVAAVAPPQQGAGPRPGVSQTAAAVASPRPWAPA